MRIICTLIFLFSYYSLLGQNQLTKELLEQHSYRFTIDEGNMLSDTTKLMWKNWIGENKMVGLAEKHHSTQLSIFTTALLPVLKELNFRNFALEMGPNSAEILNELPRESEKMSDFIKRLNNQYGKKSASKTPMVFVNKKSDALFMNRASELGFMFWGLDQEFAYSFEMLIDRVRSLEPNQDTEELYQKAKLLIHKNIFKKKVNGQAIYCWYQTNTTITAYIESIQKNQEAIKIVKDMQESWDIYCKEVSGVWSSQQRAEVMKSNYDDYFKRMKSGEKVFVKMGNVHLTHNISPFGVDDLGKYLSRQDSIENTGFLNIRFFNPYLNGKYIGNNSSVSMLQSVGDNKKWTVIDLRPIRELLIKKEIQLNEKYTYEIMNYDLLLLSPADIYDNKSNY